MSAQGKCWSWYSTGLPAILGDVEPHLSPVRELERVHAVLLLPLVVEIVRQGRAPQGPSPQSEDTHTSRAGAFPSATWRR